jgi:hypothetical protein
MPDWRRLARRKLTPLALDSVREDEIVAELAGHLEDLYADLVRRGTPEEEAVRSALSAAADWNELRHAIQLAANEEDIMNYRAKTLWLPGMCTSALAGVLLRLFQIRSAPAPHVFWVWQGMSLVLYWRWLLCLPLVGALGAYWSRRAGGKLLDRLLAASLYPLGLTCALALTFIIGFVLRLDSRVPLSIKFVALGAYIVGWGIAPFIPLLLGALPFLRGDAGESLPVAASH